MSFATTCIIDAGMPQQTKANILYRFSTLFTHCRVGCSMQSDHLNMCGESGREKKAGRYTNAIHQSN